MIVAIEDYAHVAKVPGAQRNAVDWYRYMVRTRGIPADRVSLLAHWSRDPEPWADVARDLR